MKFWFYKYLESQKSYFEKRVLNWLSRIVLLITSAPLSLMPIMFKEAEKADFKIVLRRINWLLFHGIKLKVVSDRYFDMSIGISSISAIELYAYIERKELGSMFEKELLQAQLASAVVEAKIVPGGFLSCDSSLDDSLYDNLFLSHLDKALSIIDEVKNDIPADYLEEQVAKNRLKYLKKMIRPIMSKVNNRPKVNHFSKSAIPIYFELLDLLSNINIRPFAVSGTLLGIIREDDFLAHDYDIDLGIYESELNLPALLEVIDESENFFINKCDYPSYRIRGQEAGCYARKSTPALIKIGHLSGIHTDLFVHMIDGERCWHGSSMHGWVNTAFDLGTRDFFNRQIWIPANHELYLMENYGNWRVPVVAFNCSTGTPNYSVSNSCKSICYLTKMMYDFFEKNMTSKGEEIENRMLGSDQFQLDRNGVLRYSDSLQENQKYDGQFLV